MLDKLRCEPVQILVLGNAHKDGGHSQRRYDFLLGGHYYEYDLINTLNILLAMLDYLPLPGSYAISV